MGNPDAPPIVQQPDAPPQIVCNAEANYGTPAFVEQVAQANVSMEGVINNIRSNSVINADADIVSMEIWNGYGVFENSPIAVGTYEITGTELSFDTCGVCAFLYADVVDENNPGDQYFATGGTVEITSIEGNFTATLTNVTYAHANIDPETLFTTPHPDGCGSQVDLAGVDAVLAP